MKNIAEAAVLARTMVALGKAAGVETRAILTPHNQPLGLTAGNRVEIEEAMDCLEGHGPKGPETARTSSGCGSLPGSRVPNSPSLLRSAAHEGQGPGEVSSRW